MLIQQIDKSKHIYNNYKHCYLPRKADRKRPTRPPDNCLMNPEVEG